MYHNTKKMATENKEKNKAELKYFHQKIQSMKHKTARVRDVKMDRKQWQN